MKIVVDNIKAQDKSIARGVEYQFSTYVREKFPNLIKFVEDYYRWMEQDGGVVNQIYSMPEYLDINTTDARFIEYFAYEVMPLLPQDILVDKRLLIKHVRDLYSSKGTENSVRFLFKLLFNEDIEIDYPGDRVLRCSDGEWVKTTTIKTNSSTEINIDGRKVFGKESGAVAIVDRVTPTNIDSLTVDVIELSNISGVFLIGEIIETRDDYDYYTSVLSGQLKKVTISSPGSGYVVGETLTIPEIAFSKGKIIVETVDESGGITKASIVNTGYGYLAAFTVNDVNSKGAIITVQVGALYYDSGSYISERGMLSGICVIQDSLKYQDFSYVIKSTRSLDEYKKIIYNTVHPAGTLLLADVSISSQLSEEIEINDTDTSLSYSMVITTTI